MIYTIDSYCAIIVNCIIFYCIFYYIAVYIIASENFPWGSINEVCMYACMHAFREKAIMAP